MVCARVSRTRSVIRQCVRGLCIPSSGGDQEAARVLLQLCTDRHYVSPGAGSPGGLQRGVSCSFGPLGAQLQRNLLGQWWLSVTRSKAARVLGINTPSTGGDQAAVPGQLRVVDCDGLKQVINRGDLSTEQLVHKINTVLQRSSPVRTNLLQGALEQFVPSLELVNRKLPFGLAEAGLCFQPADGSGCPAEVTQASLVWFCSPRTSSQWLDHWTRQRLKWWRKFALSLSDFSSSEVLKEDLEEGTSRGVRITYDFPWGKETLETLWSRGEGELLRTHRGDRSKLQCRDGSKSIHVPHVLSITGNMDRGVLAFLSNSLQQLKSNDGKQKLQHRKVLKLHPVLAPVKVALNINRGATLELRRVCEGLQQEFLEVKISVWPGYLETLTSMEQLNTKYDEMGVLFTVFVSETTLESGLVQVRSRDTTIKETMHISEIRNFISKYISAAENI